MQNSKRNIALSAVLAMLLYFVPNLVQDFHRVWGHQEHHISYQDHSDTQFQDQAEKCKVCFFEFNIVDEIEAFVYMPSLQTAVSSFSDNSDNQIQNKAFQYYKLRAPPQA